MITIEQFTELAHRTASRYSHRFYRPSSGAGMTAVQLPGFDSEYTLVAYTRDDLLDLADLPDEILGVPLRLHLRGATLEFPMGLDEVQLRRLTDYASVLDWHGKDLQ